MLSTFNGLYVVLCIVTGSYSYLRHFHIYLHPNTTNELIRHMRKRIEIIINYLLICLVIMILVSGSHGLS